MRTLSIRWLLLAVATVSLVVPLIAILSLRSFDSVLVRQTESELNAQAALVAALYQQAWAESQGRSPGNPRDRALLRSSYTPHHPLIESLDTMAPPFPETLPKRSQEYSPQKARISSRLSSVLRHAQVFNLSGVRVLSEDGCAIASTRDQIGTCFAPLPEVQTALRGRPSTVLRSRLSDEPTPPLTSFRRRGDIRVFVAKPVWDDGTLIGAVWLSRTAESGLEWLFKRRKDILIFTSLIVALTTLTSIAFSWSITRPLVKMSRALREDSGRQKLADIRAPREIHALGVALDERSNKLETKNRYIAEFAANVSHELKTPLTSIRGAVELLQEADDRMPATQRATFLGNIQEAVARTERLVTRLLVLARLEAPEQNHEGELVSVHAYLEQMAVRWGSSVQVVVRGPDRLFSASSLEAVVSNLVENALRYRRTEPVSLTLSVPPEKEERLHLVVEDDGPGISPENQKHIFERFFTTERDRGGTGLGLSIVDATARRHGGKARIESGPRGCRAEVWL